MPGVFTHLLTARRVLLSDQSPVEPENAASFYLGTVFPDLGYWPGNDPFFSDLAHYVGSHAVPKHLSETSHDPTVRAFASGWLLHIWLDIHGHPLVNRFAADQEDTVEEVLTFEDNPVMHARVESGLDIEVLARLDRFKEVPLTKTSPSVLKALPQAFQLFYALEIDEMERDQRLTNFPKQVRFLRGLFRVLASKSRSRLVKTLSRPFKAFAGKGRGGLVDSFVDPVRPTPDQWQVYGSMLDETTGQFQNDRVLNWPESYHNLDTGRVSRLGEYRLADEAFSRIEEKMFGLKDIEGNEETLEKWNGIKTRFLGA